MSKIAVVIEMDQTWSFWPALPENSREAPTIMLDAEFVNKFKAVSDEYHAMLDQVEDLYRIQRGKLPYGGIDLPDYTLIKQD